MLTFCSKTTYLGTAFMISTRTDDHRSGGKASPTISGSASPSTETRDSTANRVDKLSTSHRDASPRNHHWTRQLLYVNTNLCRDMHIGAAEPHSHIDWAASSSKSSTALAYLVPVGLETASGCSLPPLNKAEQQVYGGQARYTSDAG